MRLAAIACIGVTSEAQDAPVENVLYPDRESASGPESPAHRSSKLRAWKNRRGYSRDASGVCVPVLPHEWSTAFQPRNLGSDKTLSDEELSFCFIRSLSAV